MSRSIPADRFDETARALRRHLAPGDRPRPRAGGTAHLGTDLTPEVSWHVCRPDAHNEAGFQLAVNGTVLWHREAPAGHRVYVHVPPQRPQLAYDLAAAAGGRILGGAALGW